MKIYSILFFLLCCFSASSAQPQAKEVKSEAVDKFVAERMREMKIPGLALAVLEDGKITKMSVYGQANLETGSLVKPESVFIIASLGKQFISTAILLLQKDGKLALDDKVSKYLDGFPDLWKDITFRQLLNHTSGIVRDPADYRPYKQQPVTEVIEAMYAVPLNTKPGEKWLYSNVGYYILAEAITKISGKDWDKFIAERIFTPAGMTSTRTTSAAAIVPNRVSGYHQNPEGVINAENWIAVRPSGSFLSTIQDMAKWDAFLDKGNLLTESDRKLLWTRGALNDNKPVNYGLGWYVDSYLGRTRINTDGQYPGFRADYERFPDDKLSVIVLANSDNRGLERLAVKIAGFYKETLAAPSFSISVKIAQNTFSAKNPVTVEIEARNDDKKAAPRTILEMEIWDEAGKPVYKQNKANVDYAAGETKKYEFSWTPEKPGKYTVNVGTFGPRWTPDYTWNINLANIKVN
jgi:CubicO group peptidase (beta-lactamase class C family)